MDAATTTTPTAERLLPEGYYLTNFETLLDTVAERDADLLGADELELLAAWHRLSLGARRLYVRLLSRRGPLLRRDRIGYEEIPELDAALDELEHADFADDAPQAGPEELLPLCLRAELASLAGDLVPGSAPRSARKAELLGALLAGAGVEALRGAVRARLRIVRALRQEVVLVFRLLFFGNLRQDWTEFVLRDLGVMRWETYPLRRDLRLFPDRRAVDDTLRLALGSQEVAALLEHGDLEAAVAHGRPLLTAREGLHPEARRRLDRIGRRLGRALERAGQLEAALTFYEVAHRPPARERRARILARLGRVDAALSLCGEISAAPRDETEGTIAARLAHRLRRRRGESVPPARRVRRPATRRAVVREDGVSVEELALRAFAAEGRVGFFAENWLWKSLFGLAFWDVIFAPVPGAFQHPFQLGPLDLYSSDFRQARRELVEQRLAELAADPTPGPWILERWDEKFGIANAFLSWSEDLRPALALALERLNGAHLARVCDRLSRDPGRYRRGLPDLFVSSEQEPGFELYEVKAPGDVLRPEQGSWIDYLNANGLPARILHLSL